MARSRCTCGNVVLWKSDEAISDELLITRLASLHDEDTLESLLAGRVSAALCPGCGRLWIDWDGAGKFTEYVPVGPDGSVS